MLSCRYNPSSRSFYNLLDNYQRETGTVEEDTATERKEMTDFLNAIMQTP